METKLIYLEHMDQYTCPAQVTDVFEEEGRTIVILDQTVFYPQGGGQPYDIGLITAPDGRTFVVEEVREDDCLVRHVGRVEGAAFKAGDAVTCAVDVARRQLHTRLHSAGHLLDMACKKLGITWVPGKGYHFPNGPYVEYAGSLNGVDVEKLKIDLAAACNQIITDGGATRVLFKDQGERSRVVMYGDFGIPCGGTHVANLSDTGTMTIRKIKRNGRTIRVSYAVE